MFHQLLTPVADNLAASFFLAVLPIVTVFALLGIFRRPAWQASIAGVIVALVIAVAIWQFPLMLALDSVAAGATFAHFFSLIGLGAFVFVSTVIPLLLAVSSSRNADRVVRSALASIPSWVLWVLWAATWWPVLRQWPRCNCRRCVWKCCTLPLVPPC